jgi:hypothetical protein
MASLILLASGCGSKKPRPEAILISVPEVGEIATKNIGESLILQGFRIYVPAITIPKNYRLGEYQIRAGTYPLASENKEGQWFEAAVGKDGTEEVLLRSSDTSLCIDKTCAKLEYSTGRTSIAVDAKSFQQTLLYNGKIGDKVAVSYREFADGTARSAFTNEVSYDLGESKVIGYKGARLEVISATNTNITFKVISGFD